MMIKARNGSLVDVSKLSEVVAAIETFKLLRVYVAKEDREATAQIADIVKKEVRKANA